MFTFDDWNLSYDGQVLAMQHDNKSRQIIVQGTFPAGYTWAMEVQVGTAWDAIVLSPVSGGLAALLTQDNLAYAGWYEMQLRGAQGDVVRRTNIIRVHVPRSLSGTGQWPKVPSEFLQIEQRIADLNAHPSKPGVNGYWMVWDPDAQEYRESDIPLPDVSVGPAGPAATVEVAETITGAPGSDASVENLGTENAALLRFTIPSGPAGPTGTTPQISVTVTTLPAGQDVTVQVSGPAEAPTIAFGIPQGEPGERGPQGLQGFQGWGLSGAELDEDGALVLTIRNPADGQTRTLPPVPIDNTEALQAVEAAIAAQGTTQVQRVEDAGDDAVGAVRTAKDAALEVVEAKGTEEQGKLNAIVPPPTPEVAGKALVANADGTGLEYAPQQPGADANFRLMFETETVDPVSVITQKLQMKCVELYVEITNAQLDDSSELSSCQIHVCKVQSGNDFIRKTSVCNAIFHILAVQQSIYMEYSNHRQYPLTVASRDYGQNTNVSNTGYIESFTMNTQYPSSSVFKAGLKIRVFGR